MIPPTMTRFDVSSEFEPEICVAAAPWANAGAWDAFTESDGRSRADSIVTGGAAWWPLGRTLR